MIDGAQSEGGGAQAPGGAHAPDGAHASGSAPAPGGKPPLKQRLTVLFSAYGRVAIATYFTLSILTIIGFSIAFAVGFEPTTTTGVLGAIGAGWVAAKATLPIRILITLGLTPVVAMIVNRFRKPPPPPPGPDA
jgi:hypothetical protein